jgi:SAM-dependent methyltransferase
VIKRIRTKLASEGIVGIADAIRRRMWPVRRPSYALAVPLLQGKVGLEIGGPSDLFKRKGPMPAYADARKVDNCNFSRETVWEGSIHDGKTFYFDKRHAPGTQYIAEATNLSAIASETYDFVLSSHALEHVANPLRAMHEWMRVMKDGALLVLVLPHRDATFDHQRSVTLLSHIIDDYERGVTEGDLTHLQEVLDHHDRSRDPEAGDHDSFRQRSLDNAANRCLHHHVFDSRLAVQVVDHVGLEIVAVEAFRPCNILVMARKPPAGRRVHNERFRDLLKVPHWRSPFPTDRLASQ